MAPALIKPIRSVYSMMPWPLAPPVFLAPGRAEEEAESDEEEADCAAESVEADVDEDTVEPVLLALPVRDERDAQPASVAPMAIIEIRTEILMFLGSVFMAKCLVSWPTNWFLSKNKGCKNTQSFLPRQSVSLRLVRHWRGFSSAENALQNVFKKNDTRKYAIRRTKNAD